MTKEDLLKYLMERRESTRYAGLKDMTIDLVHVEAMIRILIAITWDDVTEPIGTD